ncbi:hypothetical protein NG798_24260 [Ancylothrix sp. C2]|uniref:hypothetical protein n=1 Tax=Ancylothrix sp. D3o TaxID=2953691 RepID=UPI0021BB204C|nr:hypothetical protein [Ancylothrix sp. D3o]MCT7952918.1 hypothetical protein [Ancylothrix sp. D3o]
MNDQQDKLKQREALENAYDNFVQPYIKQLIEVNPQSLPNIDVAFPGFCCASGWLALTLLYCVWLRSLTKKLTR